MPLENQALFFEEIVYFFFFFLCMLGFSNNNMSYYAIQLQVYSVKSFVLSVFLPLIWGHSIITFALTVEVGSIKIQTSEMVHQSANRWVTKIEKVRKRMDGGSKFSSFCDNLLIECSQ